MKYLILLFFPVFSLLGQQTESAPGSSGRVEMKFGISYYAPDLDALNNGFSDLERSLGLRQWGNSSMPYFASIEGRYPLFPRQWIVAEVAGGIVNRIHEDDRSLASIWRAGAGYRYQVLDIPVEVAVQGTAGFVWASFSRTYGNNAAVVNAAGNSWYLAAAATGSYPLTSWGSIELSLGYALVNSFTSATPEAEVVMKSPTVGLGFVVYLP